MRQQEFDRLTWAGLTTITVAWICLLLWLASAVVR